MIKSKIYIIYSLWLILSTLCYQSLQGQNVESMIKEEPVKFSGSLNAQALTYSTTRERASRDPFSWTISGSPTLSFYGFNVPFSFVISRKQHDFRQPFNRFGMSPYYKWLTVHAGYRNVNFSRYSMAGHTFLGGGIEATPGNFRFGFIYGRFLKAVEDDSLNVKYVIPAFKRNGYSIKLGYGTQSNYLDLIMFKAKDDSASIDRPDISTGIVPAENLVFGIKSFQRFLKNFTLDLDFGYSIFTYNLYATDVGITDIPQKSFITSLTTINNSTNVNWAGNASLKYNNKFLGLGIRYQRIQPEYETMGAYFFNNDIEQVTIDPSFYLLQRKLNIRGSIGYQRNNLGEDKFNDTFRKIHSLNVNYSPGQKISMNVSYMNFRINQSRNPLVIRDFVDSLQMKQVSTNLSFNMSYNFGTKELRQTLTISTNLQNFNDENSNTEIHNSSSSHSPSISYRFNNTVSDFSVFGTVNYNTFKNTYNTQSRMGLTAGGSKRLADNKLNMNVSATMYQNKIDDVSNGATSILRTRLNYKIFNNHTLNFSLNFISRKFKSDSQNNFNELLIRFGYSMRL
jgi:hypothetical protein